MTRDIYFGWHDSNDRRWIEDLSMVTVIFGLYCVITIRKVLSLFRALKNN